MALQLDVGGNERDLSKLARYIDPQRFEVHVAAFRPGGERVAELEAAGIPILYLPVRSFVNRTALTGAKVLRAYVRKHGIQLIHAFDPPTSIFAVVLARLSGLPIVSNHCYHRFLIPQPNNGALRLVDLLATRIVVNAEAVKRHLMKDFGVPEKRIFVSYNGVETKVFYPQSDPRPEFLRNASLVIGSICVMREEKRLETLLEAFARVLPLDPKMRLLMVGDGPMREAWKARSLELGLAEACRFEQTTTDIPRWMNCLDVFVLPSRSEGFPNALLEAMACGCCVSASAVGGVPELVEDGRSGFLFPPGDVDALANRLRAVIENPELRRATAAAAASRARDHFSMEAAAKRMEGLYDSLL
jgi:glycosyltransferase involved in cell wall biosynthesis